MNTKRSIIFISLVLVVGLFFLNGCTPKSSESKSKEVSYETPEINRDTNLGAELPFIVYESDQQVVFYNYMGIFIYDLNSSKMINAIKPLDSKFKIETQEEQTTSVDFDVKENTVIVYQVGNETIDYFYKFDISSDKLYQYPINELVQIKNSMR